MEIRKFRGYGVHVLLSLILTALSNYKRKIIVKKKINK